MAGNSGSSAQCRAKGFRFVGAVTSREGAGKHEDPAAPLQQEVHFCTASDGVRIAYAVAGRGPPLVKAANWLNHLEYDWQSPIWSRSFCTNLRASHRLVRYDERGNGLSDWDVDGYIVRSIRSRSRKRRRCRPGLERFALLGISARLRGLDRLCHSPPGAHQPSRSARWICAGQ